MEPQREDVPVVIPVVPRLVDEEVPDSRTTGFEDLVEGYVQLRPPRVLESTDPFWFPSLPQGGDPAVSDAD